MKRKIPITIFVFTVFAFVLYVGFGRTDNGNGNEAITNLKNQEQAAQFNFQDPTPEPLNPEAKSTKLKQTAWIPDWGFDVGYSSLVNNIDYFDSVSPVWYYMNEDGSVRANRVGLNRLKSLRQKYGIKIIPSIASFNADSVKAAIRNPKNLDKHLDFLKQEITKYKLDGIDLDHESINSQDKIPYINMVRQLYDFLDKREGILATTVVPKWTDDDVYSSFRQTRDTQDWQELGMYSHEFRIMTYNLTDDNSKFPGPIAPLDWMEANLRYATTKVDSEKIVLGINHYTYGGWEGAQKADSPYVGIFTNPYLKTSQAAALTYSDILVRKQGKLSDKMDGDSYEKILRYSKDGNQYIAYYQDKDTVKHRVTLSQDYGIAGVAYWRMGNEDQRVYSLVR